MAMYSASVEESAVDDCLFDNQVTGLSSRQNTRLVIN
jgi:hypothetical protein